MGKITMYTLTLFSIILILNSCILPTESAMCCLSYSRKPIRCQRLKGYTIQGINTSCNIKAIMFHTVTGRLICADPAREWTKNRIQCLNGKATHLSPLKRKK